MMRTVHREVTGGRDLGVKGVEILCKGGEENARSGISLVSETSRNREQFARRYGKWVAQFL